MHFAFIFIHHSHHSALSLVSPFININKVTCFLFSFLSKFSYQRNFKESIYDKIRSLALVHSTPHLYVCQIVGNYFELYY